MVELKRGKCSSKGLSYEVFDNGYSTRWTVEMKPRKRYSTARIFNCGKCEGSMKVNHARGMHALAKEIAKLMGKSA